VIDGLSLVRDRSCAGAGGGPAGLRAGTARTVGAGTRTWPGTGTAAEPHPQVLVGADLEEVAGEPVGERDLVQVVVLAGGQPRLDRGGGPLGTLGEHVIGAQQPQRGSHDLGYRRLLGGQRAVVRHRDPGSRGAGVVEGELQEPGRGEPQ
jgi:hypothetical protein